MRFAIYSARGPADSAGDADALAAMEDDFQALAAEHNLLIQPSGRCGDNLAGGGAWDGGRILCFYDFDGDRYIGSRIDWTDSDATVWATVWSADRDIGSLFTLWQAAFSLAP